MGGRHTDPDRGAFWRSLGSAAGKALLVLVVLAGITTLVVYLTVDTDGGDDGAAVLADAVPTSPPPTAADATPGVVPDDETDRQQPASDDRPDGGAGADDEAAVDEEPGGERAEDTATDQQAEGTPAPAAEVTVQVIDSGASSAAVNEVLGLLDGWGYDVVAVNPGLCCYEATTLFYSDGRAADAEALQARDERFAVLEENRRLDEAVALHVVVGEDWHAP